MMEHRKWLTTSYTPMTSEQRKKTEADAEESRRLSRGSIAVQIQRDLAGYRQNTEARKQYTDRGQIERALLAAYRRGKEEKLTGVADPGQGRWADDAQARIRRGQGIEGHQPGLVLRRECA
jgi:hypothetical protein